jgi:hypothetical protein
MALARRFEGEAFYIKVGVAGEGDFDFLRYTKSFLWTAIHPEITPNDGIPGLDHFRSDSFRPVLDYCYARRDGLPQTLSRDDRLIFDWERFQSIVAKLRSKADEKEMPDTVARTLAEMFAFFDGLERDGDMREDGSERRRWDRLVALHLFVLAFIGSFGYSWQRSDVMTKASTAVSHLRDPANLLEVFTYSLPRLGFERAIKPSSQSDMGLVMRALERSTLRSEATVAQDGESTPSVAGDAR